MMVISLAEKDTHGSHEWQSHLIIAIMPYICDATKFAVKWTKTQTACTLFCSNI